MTETPNGKGAVTVTVCAQSDLGKVRGNNEDSFLIAQLAHESARPAPPGLSCFSAIEAPVLLAVSDGMGGANAGEVASALVVESLMTAMAPVCDNFEKNLQAAVEHANGDVWTASREPGKRGMGATLTAVCIHGDEAHIAEVGDSRAYLVRGDSIRQITRDQSFVQVLIDSGALKPEEAAKNPMKNVVLQAMGQSAQVKVAIGRLELRRGDRLILCSDGLSNKVTDPEIKKIVDGGAVPDGICERLIALANDRGGEDNITVVVADVSGEGVAEAQPVESVTQTLHVLAEYRAAPHVEASDDDDDPPVSDGAPPTKRGPPVIAAVEPTLVPVKGPSHIVLAIATGVLLALTMVYFLAR